MPAPEPAYVHKAEVVAIHDGDTFTARIDLGRYPTKVWVENPIRVRGLWCAELSQPGGADAHLGAVHLLMNAKAVIVQTIKPPSAVESFSFQRLVADVWIDGVEFAGAMVAAGYGFATERELKTWLEQQRAA
jgi:endonuclease YncB( thermonuclease family)